MTSVAVRRVMSHIWSYYDVP